MIQNIGAGVLAMILLAAGGAASPLAVPVETVSPQGYALASATAVKRADGARIHGSVCVKSRLPPPNVVRVEQISSTGQVLGSRSERLTGLGGRLFRCTFFNVQTAWTIGPSDRIRACALRSDGPCGRPK